jgi:hypothetical protein
MIVERHLMFGRRENDGTRDQVLGRSSGIIFDSRLPLRNGYISGCLDELGKLLVGDIGLVHPEAIDINAMNRTGIGRTMHSCSICGRRV